MEPTALTPLWLFASSSILTIWSLGQIKHHIRVLALLPIWLFNYFALKTCHRLTWPGGLSSTFASLVVYYFFHSLKLLILDYNPAWSSLGFVQAYKTWNNPRQLPTEKRLLTPTSSSSSGTRNNTGHLEFAIYKILKILFLFATDTYLVQRIVLVRIFTGATPSDFSPYYELFTFQLSAKQALIRATISVQWIWTAFYLLESSHCVLSLAFASLLRWDEPAEWPSLWGCLGSATSVRAFWSKVWNRIVIPTFGFYAQLIVAHAFGIQKGSGTAKVLVPFFVFLLSGLSHSAGGWAVGDAALGRDVLFFMLNFLACAVETGVGRIESWKRCREKTPVWLVKIGGMVYLFGFWFAVVPLWMYPKVYGALLSYHV